LLGPDSFDKQGRVEPLSGAVAVEGKVAATGAGAEGDDGKQPGAGGHLQQGIEVGLRAFVQNVGRALAEQARDGQVDVVGAQGGEAVEVRLGVGVPSSNS
jgi:hypothetical protein